GGTGCPRPRRPPAPGRRAPPPTRRSRRPSTRCSSTAATATSASCRSSACCATPSRCGRGPAGAPCWWSPLPPDRPDVATSETGYDLALPTRRLSASQALELGERVEAAGGRGGWLSEVLALDALVTLGMLAARTPRLRLGTCIVPITTRSPAVLAMAAATLAQLAPGRIHLGLGLSTPGLVAERHGRPVRRPLAEARGAV